MKPFESLAATAWPRRLLFPILLLALVIYYLHGMAGYVSPLSTPDEFGYVSVAAFLNGKNWTAVAHGNPWSSYGYSLLLAPIFAVTSPAHWYRDAQSVNLVLIVVLGICANLFLRKIDRVIQPWLRHLVVAVIMLYPSVVFYVRLAWTETLIAVLPWLLGLLMYRVFEVPRRYLDAFLCGCLLIAAYYIHARLIVLVIAGLLVFGFVTLKTGQWRELCLAILGMIVVLIPAWWFKNYLLLHLYGGGASGPQTSILDMLVSVWHRGGDAAAWRDLLGSAAGQAVYLVIATLGLLVVGLAVLVHRIKQSCRQSEWPEFAALSFVLLCAIGCYALVLMTMGMSPTFPQHIFYGRYTEPLILPMVALGLLHLCRAQRRIFLWMLVAFVIACVLVPAGVYVARQLPNQVTYWTLITGLFTYRNADWQLAVKPLLFGFLFAVVTLSLAFRLHRYVGLTLVAILFLLANIGLIQTFASATYSHVQRWRAWAGPVFEMTHPQVLLGMRGGEFPFLPARVQVINDGLEIVPENRWHPDQASVYERIDRNGKSVKHSLCKISVTAQGGRPTCTKIAADPYQANVKLNFDADAVVARRAFLSKTVYLCFSRLPYLRSVSNALSDSHVRLRYAITSPVANEVTVKVFVTKLGSGVWLTDRQKSVFMGAGAITGSMRAPVSVRSYTGARLPKGDYVLHAVVVDLDGNDWATMVSIPMRID